MTGTCTCDGTSPLCGYCLAERQRIIAERLAELDAETRGVMTPGKG
jgi:hypothetical protein